MNGDGDVNDAARNGCCVVMKAWFCVVFGKSATGKQSPNLRRVRDSNPRNGQAVHRISSPAQSVTLATLLANAATKVMQFTEPAKFPSQFLHRAPRKRRNDLKAITHRPPLEHSYNSLRQNMRKSNQAQKKAARARSHSHDCYKR